jgi:hypothetical protein
MMTDPDNRPPRHWYIPVPAKKFPQPKFHLDQQVRSHWGDEQGIPQYEIGEIIGMQYGASCYHLPEWSYLIRLKKSDFRPWLVGSDDGIYVYESSLIADDTAIPH